MFIDFFRYIGNFFTNIANRIIGFFRGKNPIDAINDTTKVVIGAATAGVSVYAAANIVRAHLIPRRVVATTAQPAKSGVEYIMNKREAGTIDQKVAEAHFNTANITKSSVNTITTMKQEELNMLAAIAETRNAYFKEMTPEEQMNVLITEGFDFEAFKDQNQSAASRAPIAMFKTETNPSKPFREEKDYGVFNFIMRPLSDFYHWVINDPVPKKCEQIHLIDMSSIPNIQCRNTGEVVQVARALNSYLESNRQSGVMYDGRPRASTLEEQIMIEEAFRHDSLEKYNTAVNRRVKRSMANPSLYALLGDEKEGRRLDRDREDRRRRERDRYSDDRERDRRPSIFADDDDGDDDDYEERARFRKNPSEAEADRQAQELFSYHLKQVRAGKIDRAGFNFRL